MTIEEVIKQREIKRLVHFTRVENLPAILKNGIRPRSELSADKAVFNDPDRYDKCTNAICTSIGYPNYKMLYSLRQQQPETDWAIFTLSPEVLTKLECAFCESNAGSAEMFSIPLEQRRGGDALMKLFAPESRGVKRAKRLAKGFPTDPQAEVLVFGTIPTEMITHIYFPDKRALDHAMKLTDLMKYSFSVDGYYFGSRWDFKNWQKTE